MSARYVCLRCDREVKPWPIARGDICAPRWWAYCIRQLSADDVSPDGESDYSSERRPDPTRYTEARKMRKPTGGI